MSSIGMVLVVLVEVRSQCNALTHKSLATAAVVLKKHVLVTQHHGESAP